MERAAGSTVASWTAGLLAGMPYGPLVSQRRSSTSRFYHPSLLGTIEALTDAAGDTTDSYVLDAFGVSHASSGSTPNPHVFIGSLGYYADPLGPLYVRTRWLRASTGSWLSADPVLSEPRYQYVGGRAGRRADAAGRGACDDLLAQYAAAVLAGNIAAAQQLYAAYLMCLANGGLVNGLAGPSNVGATVSLPPVGGGWRPPPGGGGTPPPGGRGGGTGGGGGAKRRKELVAVGPVEDPWPVPRDCAAERDRCLALARQEWNRCEWACVWDPGAWDWQLGWGSNVVGMFARLVGVVAAVASTVETVVSTLGGSAVCFGWCRRFYAEERCSCRDALHWCECQNRRQHCPPPSYDDHCRWGLES